MDQFAWTTPAGHHPPPPPPQPTDSGIYVDRQPSVGSYSSGISPYPSPLVPGERSSSSTASGSVLQPVKEDMPFTSPPLSFGGMASMADTAARLGSGYLPQGAAGPGGPGSGFGELVSTPMGSGSVGEIWGQGEAAAASGDATDASPFRHDAFLASTGAPFSNTASGLSTPYEPFPVAPPSTAALIAARPFTANAASALVFMSQSGSLDGIDGTADSPIFAADAMLQRVTQDGRYAPEGVVPSDVPPFATRPGSSSQNAPSQVRPMSAHSTDPQQFAYGTFPTTRNSFAMENLSLQQQQVAGGQAFAAPSNATVALPDYHQPPAAALHFGTVPPPVSNGRPTSSHMRPQSQSGPDRRPLQGNGMSHAPSHHVRSGSLASRAHPYSRPAFNSMSAATPVAQGWNGSIDSTAQSFAQLYQQHASMRPQTSDGVPMSYYGSDWGLSMSAPIFQPTGITPSSYAPSNAYTAAPSNRPSTSYAAQTASMLDPPRSVLPPFADPRQLQSKPPQAARTKPEQPQTSIAPPSSSKAAAAPQPQTRRRANSAAVPRASASTTTKPKPKPKAAPPAADSDSDEEPPEREISAVTGRPKRPRRKFEEVERNYVCSFDDCGKAYGTLNHLNAHVLSQNHGPKRLPAEFRDLRKLWRKQRRERAAAEGGGKGAKGKGKRKAAPATAAGKRRKSSADTAAADPQSRSGGSDDEDDSGEADGHGGGRRESMVSRTSTGAGDEDDDDDSASDDDDQPPHASASGHHPNGNGARRFSSPAFVSTVPTPPNVVGAMGGGYPSPYYNLEIPSYSGGSSALALQQPQQQPSMAGVSSAPSPFADWSFANSPSVPSHGGNGGPSSAATFLAPTPGMYDAVALDFGAGPPSESSTTAGTPRLGNY